MFNPQKGYLEQFPKLAVITLEQVSKALLSDVSFPGSNVPLPAQSRTRRINPLGVLIPAPINISTGTNPDITPSLSGSALHYATALSNPVGYAIKIYYN